MLSFALFSTIGPVTTKPSTPQVIVGNRAADLLGAASDERNINPVLLGGTLPILCFLTYLEITDYSNGR